MLEVLIRTNCPVPPDIVPVAHCISVVARMVSPLILPVAEIEVAEMLDTEIRPVTEMSDADKFETKAEVAFKV